MSRLAALLLVLAAAALAACGSGSDDNDGSQRDQGSSGDGTPARTTTTRVEVVEGLDGGRFDPRAIYEREAPGVVTVLSVFGGASSLEDILGGGGNGEGLGSGFVLNGRGEIATNAHVVVDQNDLRRAREVFVRFADDNQVPARIVGVDPDADIALLRIDPAGLSLRPLPLGQSKGVEVGQPVAAIGSPFGAEQSLSVGVVSATDRTIPGLTQFGISGAVQTDAAINPGNSGGPLVNAKGEVIGVNQSIRSRSGGGEGVGFAVPVDAVRYSLDQLREKGKVEYPFLGVESVGVYPQLAKRFDLPVDRGAWLQRITNGGPADDAGLRGGRESRTRFQEREYLVGGDVVTKVEGQAIEDSDDLSTAIGRFRPGQRVTVEVYRGDERREVELTLGERPLRPAGR